MTKRAVYISRLHKLETFRFQSRSNVIFIVHNMTMKLDCLFFVFADQIQGIYLWMSDLDFMWSLPGQKL